MDAKKAAILTRNINTIIQKFELNSEFWDELAKSNIFPVSYINQMRGGDTETDENKKKNIVIDLKRRESLCYERFSQILRKMWKSDILDQYMLCQDKDAYPIVASRPGTCLIINNKNFVTCDPREGSEKDVEMFKSQFERLNYEVICHQDLSRSQLLEQLQRKSRDKALKEHDIFVTIIMSHGISGHIITSDNELVSYDEILQYFSNEHCHYLVDKPKVFIINSCRSPDDDRSESRITQSNTKTGHTFSDILMIFSTLNYYLSVRDEESGTLFAQAFTQAMENNPSDEVCSIVTKANNRLIELVRNDPKNRVEKGQAIEQRKLGPQKNFYFATRL